MFGPLRTYYSGLCSLSFYIDAITINHCCGRGERWVLLITFLTASIVLGEKKNGKIGLGLNSVGVAMWLIHLERPRLLLIRLQLYPLKRGLCVVHSLQPCLLCSGLSKGKNSWRTGFRWPVQTTVFCARVIALDIQWTASRKLYIRSCRSDLIFLWVYHV